LEDYVAALPAREQAQIDARAAALHAELGALRELGRALRAAAPAMAERLKTTPAGVQKMERRVDAYVMALREALARAGGTLDIVVRLPDRAPVPLTQFEGLLGAGEAAAEGEAQ
jgi:hypothetical protein